MLAGVRAGKKSIALLRIYNQCKRVHRTKQLPKIATNINLWEFA